MKTLRYPQFCALARAAELLGERWTLLIVRELLLGPRRFSDLRERLDGISPSVLTARLARVEALGLVRRASLPPPAASSVYELTEDGRALRPAVYELIRWGGRFLFPPRRGERTEPDWMLLALAACARRGPSPRRTVRLEIRDGAKRATVHVAGGPEGTVVTDRADPAEATIVASVPTILALMSGALDPAAAVAAGRIETSGDPAAVEDFARMFEVDGRSTEDRPREAPVAAPSTRTRRPARRRQPASR